MKKNKTNNLFLILSVIFVSCGNTQYKKIKDVCEWYHKEIIGWHENNIYFRKRHLEISDKTKYKSTDDKTIEKKLVKQKKLKEAIDNSQEQLQTLSKIYHNLECTRFERKFEKKSE